VICCLRRNISGYRVTFALDDVARGLSSVCAGEAKILTPDY
jgi:hypothetical protein